MTTQEAFSTDEWASVLDGPVNAGMIVLTATRGGTLRETLAVSKTYVEARRLHGESELLDDIVASRPKAGHTRYHSADELREHGLRSLRDAVTVLEGKATAEEVDGYRRFVLTVAHNVAAAHREHGHSVSPAERRAIEQIGTAMAGRGS